MQDFRITTRMTAFAALVVLLGVVPEPAAAGLCEDLGLAKQCVKKSDVEAGSMGTGKLADKAVTTQKLAPLSVGKGKLKPGAVTNDKIAPGAVTDDKLAPAFVAVTPAFLRTVVVSPVGTATENGTALRSALAGITDNSSTNPWLIKIEPGIYDVGTTRMQTKPFVDIEGSGENTTVILGNPDSTVSGVVHIGSNSELRHLTVEHTGGGNAAVAISLRGFNSKITHVTAIAPDVLNSARAISVARPTSGIGVGPILTNVTAQAGQASESIGVLAISNVDLEMVNVTAIGISTGLSLNLPGGSNRVTASNCVVKGGNRSVTLGPFSSATGTAHFASTQLDGVADCAGACNCVDAYDGSFAALDAGCNPLP